VAFWVRTPTGFIPAQDQGYLIAVVQMPPVPPQRTDEVTLEAARLARMLLALRVLSLSQASTCANLHLRLTRVVFVMSSRTRAIASSRLTISRCNFVNAMEHHRPAIF